ncbi:MAG: BtrH N-terminal domain-containing protein [Promethearchaeota archaeon]
MSNRYVINDFNFFGGLHCETSAVRKIFLYHDLPISEEMLFGLGGGIGFIYWYVKQMPTPMVGGRGGGRYFIEDAVRRAGAALKVKRTTSSKKGHTWLLDKLASNQPAVLYGDMAYLPYMGVPEDAHFGQHVFVVYGVDEVADVVYISDRGQHGVSVTVEELKRARASKFPPWPPQHAIFDFHLPSKLTITYKMVLEALHFTVDTMMNPPIRNLGLKGMEKWAELVVKWPKLFPGEKLWNALYQGFIYIETGGTGGSSMRPMFTRYLREVSELFSMKGMERVIAKYEEAGKVWSKIAISLLPNEYPMLRRVREWILEQNRIGEAREPGTLQQMLKINHQINTHMDAITAEIAHAPEFLQTTQEKILQLYEVEKEAIQLLQDVIKES